jgi:hypothetical protein
MRDQLLKETDKYVLPDYPITPENLILIKQHRQTLRDYITTIYEDMEELPPFPTLPKLS